MKNTKFLILFLAIACVFAWANSVFAYSVENLNIQSEGDIVVGPGKTEVSLDPGGSYTQQMLVTNRSGVEKIIDISVEDFQGTNDPNETIQFLGNQNGPYSLKDYVKPEINHIILQNGQRLTLPVVISIPTTAAPGGLYGAVMVSASNVNQATGQVQGNNAASSVNIITRIASLFFVTVKGTVVQTGELKNFTSDKNFYESGPVTFDITSQNTGSIYLSPYGTIEVSNMLGQKIDERQIDPWFVMPSSTRERQILWNGNYLFGRYTATLLMNRGYQNIVDTKSYSFWIIPWKIISIILIGLILAVWFFIWIFSHIEWKKSENPPSLMPPVKKT